MNPSARLRKRPRSAWFSDCNGRPSTSTDPPVGASRPPRRCRSVLLPDPDAPTMATRSPGATSRSTPMSTGTCNGPLRYVLRKSRHCNTCAASLIPQRFGRVDLGGAPARIKRGQQCKRQRDDGDQADVASLQVGRQFADVINALVEELDAEESLDERHHGADIERQRNATGDTEQCAYHADQRALDDKDREDARRRRTERAQNRDVRLLVG